MTQVGENYDLFPEILPIIVVTYESEVLGSGEFFRGSIEDIKKCRNVVARDLALKSAGDGKPHKDGMWRSRIEVPQ